MASDTDHKHQWWPTAWREGGRGREKDWERRRRKVGRGGRRREGRENQTLCAFWWKNTPLPIVLPNGLEMRLMKPLIPAANFQEIPSTKEHVELHHEYAISKIQPVRNSAGYMPLNLIGLWWFSHQVTSDSCNPMDYSPPSSSVHGILQERILEWVAIPFSRVSSWSWY